MYCLRLLFKCARKVNLVKGRHTYRIYGMNAWGEMWVCECEMTWWNDINKTVLFKKKKKKDTKTKTKKQKQMGMEIWMSVLSRWVCFVNNRFCYPIKERNHLNSKLTTTIYWLYLTVGRHWNRRIFLDKTGQFYHKQQLHQQQHHISNVYLEQQ